MTLPVEFVRKYLADADAVSIAFDEDVALLTIQPVALVVEKKS